MQLFRVLRSILSHVGSWQRPVEVSDPRAVVHAIQSRRGGRFVVFVIGLCIWSGCQTAPTRDVADVIIRPGAKAGEALHEFDKFPPQTMKITVTDGGSASADFTFKGPSS